MKKHGAFTMELTIAVIGIVITLAILLPLVIRALSYQGIDKEACHQSVLQRGTIRSDTIGIDATSVIPLNCKTEKICISKEGEDCLEFPKPSKDNPITEVKIGNKNPSIETMDKISESLYDCHEMLSEGNLNFAPANWGFTDKNYCIICSRIAFDEKAKREVPDISYGELYRFMQQKKNKNNRSYLSFVYNWNDWSSAKALFENVKSSNANNPNVPSSFEEWKILPSKPAGYVIIAQLTQKDRIGQLAGIVGTGTGLLLGGPIGWGIAIGGGVLTFNSTPDSEDIYYAAPTIIPYDVETLRSLGCTSFETAPSKA